MQQKKVVLHIRPDKRPFQMKQGLVKDEQQVGQAADVMVAPPTQWIPNGYHAFVVKTKAENGKYEGKFDFVNADNPSAELIEVRYLATCPSLDKQWQIENGRDPKSDEELVGWPFRSGEKVEYDVTAANKQWIHFMLNHESCGTNVNRDANLPSLFIEVDTEKELIEKSKELSLLAKKLKKEQDEIQSQLEKIKSTEVKSEA